MWGKVNKKLFTILILVSFISSIVIVVGIYPSSTENNYSNNFFSNDISHEIEEKLKKIKDNSSSNKHKSNSQSDSIIPLIDNLISKYPKLKDFGKSLGFTKQDISDMIQKIGGDGIKNLIDIYKSFY